MTQFIRWGILQLHVPSNASFEVLDFEATGQDIRSGRTKKVYVIDWGTVPLLIFDYWNNLLISKSLAWTSWTPLFACPKGCKGASTSTMWPKRLPKRWNSTCRPITSFISFMLLPNGTPALAFRSESHLVWLWPGRSLQRLLQRGAPSLLQRSEIWCQFMDKIMW